MSKTLELSELPHTWIFDIDGTILKHNGYLFEGDEVLEGAREFFETIPEQDKIILLSAREASIKEQTEKFLQDNGFRFDEIIFDVPAGERILVNDSKPSGLMCAYAINLKRDGFDMPTLEINKNL